MSATPPSASEPVALRLLDREFLIACAPEEREGLLQAATYLDQKMRELRASSLRAIRPARSPVSCS
jgi:cell division protein ZapA